MAKIKIDVQKVEKVSRSLSDLSDEIDVVTAMIKTVYDETGVAWKSQYTPKYLDTVNETRVRLDKLSGEVYSISRELKRIATNVRETEEKLKTIMRQSN